MVPLSLSSTALRASERAASLFAEESLDAINLGNFLDLSEHDLGSKEKKRSSKYRCNSNYIRVLPSVQ